MLHPKGTGQLFPSPREDAQECSLPKNHVMGNIQSPYLIPTEALQLGHVKMQGGLTTWLRVMTRRRVSQQDLTDGAGRQGSRSRNKVSTCKVVVASLAPGGIRLFECGSPPNTGQPQRSLSVLSLSVQPRRITRELHKAERTILPAG